MSHSSIYPFFICLIDADSGFAGHSGTMPTTPLKIPTHRSCGKRTPSPSSSSSSSSGAIPVLPSYSHHRSKLLTVASPTSTSPPRSAAAVGVSRERVSSRPVDSRRPRERSQSRKREREREHFSSTVASHSSRPSHDGTSTADRSRSRRSSFRRTGESRHVSRSPEHYHKSRNDSTRRADGLSSLNGADTVKGPKRSSRRTTVPRHEPSKRATDSTKKDSKATTRGRSAKRSDKRKTATGASSGSKSSSQGPTSSSSSISSSPPPSSSSPSSSSSSSSWPYRWRWAYVVDANGEKVDAKYWFREEDLKMKEPLWKYEECVVWCWAFGVRSR